MSAQDFALVEPIHQAIARDLVKSRGHTAVRSADLADAIEQVVVKGTIKGANTLEITLDDPDWALFDSGFFDADKDSKLDAIDINFPHGSRHWWRLTQVKFSGVRTIGLVFIDRVAVRAMFLQGPKKADRAKATRAEFIKSLFGPVATEFHSEQLHVKQKIAPIEKGTKSSGKRDGSGQGRKEAGIGADRSGLTVKGAPITQSQVEVANTLLSVAQQEGAPAVATVALIYAGIWESALDENAANADFWGVLSGRRTTWKQHDTTGMARAFLRGGGGFQSGGAIALSKSTGNPVEIAVRVEAPSFWPDNAYARQAGYPGDTVATAEAEAIAQAGGAGGISSGSQSHTVIEQYNFEVAPHETYWDAAQRLASEVNWELFLDGDRVYFDSDLTLIRQKPALVVNRNDPSLVDWDATWDVRQICTQVELDLICDLYEFPAGEVFVLKGFGPASTGSTARPPLPGRWLVQDFERVVGEFSTKFTLVQPQKPKLEPAPQTKQVSGVERENPQGPINSVVQAAKRALAEKSKYEYVYGGGHTPSADLFGKEPRMFDCSSFAEKCYQAAKQPDPAGGDYTAGTQQMIENMVKTDKPQPGDLCFFGTLSHTTHVNIYIGNGRSISMGEAGDPSEGPAEQMGPAGFLGYWRPQ